MIVPHLILKSMFTEFMPEIKGIHYGNVSELKNYMNIKANSNIYPLAWVELPYTSDDSSLSGNFREVPMRLFFATTTRKEWLNDKREIETLEFMPDTLFINPQDKWRLGLSQDADGAFYLNIPAGTAGIPTMLGFNVITSTRVTAGSFGLAESGLWNLEEEAIRIKAGYGITVTKDGSGTNVTDVEHDLDHNRFRLILEMYFHSYIGANNGGSYAFDTFANIRTALTAA